MSRATKLLSIPLLLPPAGTINSPLPDLVSSFNCGGPGFGPTCQLIHLHDALGRPIIPTISPRVDQGVDKLPTGWTAYRRNYLSLSAAYSFENAIKGDSYIDNQKVKQFLIHLRLHSFDDDSVQFPLAIVSRDRDKRYKLVPVPVGSGQLNDPSDLKQRVTKTISPEIVKAKQGEFVRYTRLQVDSSSWSLPVRYKQGTQLVVELWAVTETEEKFMVAFSELDKILFTLTLRNLIQSPEGSPCRRRKRTLDDSYSKPKRLCLESDWFRAPDEPTTENLASEEQDWFVLPESSVIAIEDPIYLVGSPEKYCAEGTQLPGMFDRQQGYLDPPMTPNPTHLFSPFATSTPNNALHSTYPGYEYWEEIPMALFDDCGQSDSPLK